MTTRRTIANKTRYPRLYSGRPCRIVGWSRYKGLAEFKGGELRWCAWGHLRKRYMKWITKPLDEFTGDILYPGGVPSEPQHVNCRCFLVPSLARSKR